jgi:hypothetical protein
MINLRWTVREGIEASCEHGHLCAWIEQLPWDRRFAWVVDTPDDSVAADGVIIYASGVATGLTAAQDAVAEAMESLGASQRGSWRKSEPGVVVAFPARPIE